MTQQQKAPDRSIVVVVVGGDPGGSVRLPQAPPAGATVVAVDSGLDHLHAAGWQADRIIGDLDSVSPAALTHAEARGATVDRHPADKDATDLELGLDAVVDGDLGDRVLVVGPGGGRLDHLLADTLLLASERLRGREVTARFGPATLSIVRAGMPRSLVAVVGEQLSVLPVHGPARGVTTTGVRWPLVDADLRAGTTRAMSNEATASPVGVELADGVLVVVQPGTRAPELSPRSLPYNPTPRGVFDDR